VGAGIGTMHYTGMAAIRLEGFVRYDPVLFGLSIFAAVALAYVALRVKESATALFEHQRDALIAISLGFAVSGMHYTAMAAAYFVHGDVAELPASAFTPNTLAVVIAIATAFVALGALTLASISRNKEITDQLRESEKSIRLLLTEKETTLSNALVGIVYIKQRRIISCNRRFEQIFQFDPGELIGESTDRLYESVETYDQIGAFAYPVTAQTDGFTGEARLRRKDGMGFWGTLSGKAIDSDHPQDGSIWIFSDIDERKKVEEELRIASIAFESQEGMLITDANKIILRVNRAFTATTGYTAQDAIGQTPRILESERHTEEFYEAMWDDIHREGVWKGEIWHRRKNGEIYPEWLTITAVKSSTGIVTHYVGTHIDITARKTADDQIAFLAFHDALTGLPNRRLLMDRLSQAMASSSRSVRHGALFLLDLDDFKTLNDTLGHDMGDLLLVQVGQRLTNCVREGDTVARLGGDEFVVLLELLGENAQEAATQAEDVGNKIFHTLSQRYRLVDHEVGSTPSIGVTLFIGHEKSIEELLKQADLAMYQAKADGRNTLRFFDPKMQTMVSERASLEVDLRDAIRLQQFCLYYQPQVTGPQGRLMGAEALIRWQHPLRGLVPPAEFISLAEETSLILPIGLWVLKTACAQLARWSLEPGWSQLTLAVNISAKQLQQVDFVEQVLAVLARTGAKPHLLKLELTESLLVSNVDSTIGKMMRLKAMGVKFSLDDFGTGYSSLAYLKKLPLDQIKIDQGFVRDILTDPNDAAIAKMVIVLAESLGLPAIAEGVETLEQRDFLGQIGCDQFQGYFFSRPLPLEKFEAYAHAAASMTPAS
jgi:diguanylate cyclase (GGDEF)-like protein/PAS domain S-box-containing protein